MITSIIFVIFELFAFFHGFFLIGPLDVTGGLFSVSEDILLLMEVMVLCLILLLLFKNEKLCLLFSFLVINDIQEKHPILTYKLREKRDKHFISFSYHWRNEYLSCELCVTILCAT